MMENMNPTNVAESAERQLLALKKSQDKKIKEVQDERAYIVSLRRTLSDLIYATGTAFKSVYPQAEGFIEGRIKSLDSIEIKTRNEFTEVLSHIEENPNNHVLYRVTPIYDGNNLVASGVQMEAYSVEDNGKGICFNIYVYNVQPGIFIDYKTGESKLASK